MKRLTLLVFVLAAAGNVCDSLVELKVGGDADFGGFDAGAVPEAGSADDSATDATSAPDAAMEARADATVPPSDAAVEAGPRDATTDGAHDASAEVDAAAEAGRGDAGALDATAIHPDAAGDDAGPAAVDAAEPDAAEVDDADADAGETALQICAKACEASGACGAGVAANCPTGCVSLGAAYVACLAAAKNDCNAIAACFFANNCGNTGPVGTASCQDTQACEGSCNQSSPTQPARKTCNCGCQANMAPATAFDLYVNNQCAVPCLACYPNTFDASACNACAGACVAADKCSTE